MGLSLQPTDPPNVYPTKTASIKYPHIVLWALGVQTSRAAPAPRGLCLLHLELRPNGSGVTTEGSIS